MESINLYLGAFVILCFFCLWRIVNYLWLRPRRLGLWLRSQGFKGNPYKFWYGDVQDLTRMMSEIQSKSITVEDDIKPYVLPFHHHIVKKYGKRSFMWNGPNPRVFIMDPTLIREVLNKHEVFVKLFSNPLNKLYYLTGLIVHEGQKWAKHRRIVNPAFTITKLKDMIPAMHVSCTELVKKWQTMILNKGCHEIDVWPYLTNFSADVISRTAFGTNYEQGKKIFDLQREQARLVVQLSRSVYVPGFRFLPTKTNKRMKEIDKEVKGIVRGIIEKREEEMKSEGEYKKDDLLGILLEEKENGNIGKQVGKMITIEEVIEECRLFYIAGQETTSTLLLWTMVMLSIHQDWQMQAREEVLQVFGRSTKPDFDGLYQLKKVHMILQEVLRLYSPAPTIMRIIHDEKTKLGDITLPRGLELILPILFVHHDKEIWGEDAQEFKPQRFGQGVRNAAAKDNIAAFFPFGLGPRICIGQNFAMLEAKLALAMILQHFSFHLSPSYQHAPIQVLTLQPKYGAKIMLSTYL